MRNHLILAFVVLIIAIANFSSCPAQLPGPGNIDWQEVWRITPPDASDTTSPYAWMRGKFSYTGLAYDSRNDVIYIVSPGGTGSSPRIYAWDANSGTPALFIGDSTLSPPGHLCIDSTIYPGQPGGGIIPLYKIDLDDDGRIYSTNVVTPVFGMCYPGPPPACIPAYANQGPFKVYRWDTHDSRPELMYKTAGTDGSNSEMTWTMFGTVLEVTSGMRNVNGQPYDSTRIYTSGSSYVVGTFPPNDEVNVLVSDTRASAPTPFRLGVRLKLDSDGHAWAAHGIAATGPYKDSPLYIDSNDGSVYLGYPDQDTSAMPQSRTMSLSSPLPSVVTRKSGPIRFLRDSCSSRSYLLCADGWPFTTGEPGEPNLNTSARMVDLSTGPNFVNWPPTETPPLGTNMFDRALSANNYITDVDYKYWISDSGNIHIQVFVLMSNNGIACYRSRFVYFCSWPVELTSFTATASGDEVVLKWQTASEENNHGFEVHRTFSKNADWQKIGFVPGQGSTHKLADYSFTDPLTPGHSNAGTVKYRLRQVDFDGSSEWSPIVDVVIEEIIEAFLLHQNYPNPFNPATEISYQLKEPGYVSLKIFSSVGDEVATLVEESLDAGLHAVEFDAGDLPSGTYLYQINVDGKMAQKKMILMK